MGLLDTLKNALGLQRALEVRPADTPLRLRPRAVERLSTLPEGYGLHVRAVPTETGHTVQVEEGPLQGPPPPAWERLPLTASDADVDRLRCLELDHDGVGWQVSLSLELRARETPNPDGRLYLCDRVLVHGDDALFFQQGDVDAPGPVPEILAHESVVSVLLRSHTLTVVRAPSSPWPAIDRVVDQALRSWFLRLGQPLHADTVPQLSDPLAQQVLAVLEQHILPGVHRDGGDIELLGVRDGVARVRMSGACAGCPSSSATLTHGVEATLRKAFPGRVERVEAV
jgi:Fe-S cluster biogenesis protein NfuA